MHEVRVFGDRVGDLLRLQGSLSTLCELLANCCGVLNFASAGVYSRYKIRMSRLPSSQPRSES
jgi:hypothetical protein